MTLLKVFHLLSLFVWIGNLLTLTRLLSFFPKEDAEAQIKLAQLCKKIYLYACLPALLFTIATGLALLPHTKFGASLGWFHMKLTFFVFLVVCDQITGYRIRKLQATPAAGKGSAYKILHYTTALFLIGALCSIYVVRNKEAEIRARIKHETEKQLGKNIHETL